jgi:hypothetical protein
MSDTDARGTSGATTDGKGTTMATETCAAEEIAHFAVMTGQDVVIRTQRTAGHWYIVARRSDSDELALACDSWNDAQHQVAVAMRLVNEAGDDDAIR